LLDELIYREAENNISAKWGLYHSFWVFGVSTPSDYISELHHYTLKDCASKIKCSMLIIDNSIDNSSDPFMNGQAKQLYDALKCPKEFYMFTSENAAQSYCQMGATSFSNAIMFNWLDKVMKNN
jgi:hypothetical protein